MKILGVQAVDADAVPAMFNSRAVHVAALSEMDADVGAALRAAEEDQITGSQFMHIIRLNRQRLAEPFLLVGISGQPDPCAGEGGLNETRAVQIGTDGASPEVGVVKRGGSFQPFQNRIQPSGDLRA